LTTGLVVALTSTEALCPGLYHSSLPVLGLELTGLGFDFVGAGSEGAQDNYLQMMAVVVLDDEAGVQVLV